MKRFSWFAIVIAVAISTAALAQDAVPSRVPPGGFHQIFPWAVGCSMKGTVTNVMVADGHIQFRLTGWFWFHQYPEGGTNEEIVRVDCRSGTSVTMTQTDSFVAETTDWTGGSVQNSKERMVEILKAAEKRGNEVKFSLISPKIDFGAGTNHFTVLDGKIWQITDADLH